MLEVSGLKINGLQILKRNLAVFCGVVFDFMLSGGLLCAQESLAQRENAIKAGFLVGMQEFVTWELTHDSEKNVTYATIGDASFGEIIERAVAAKKRNLEDFQVAEFTTVEDITFVNFLFVRDYPEEEIGELVSRCTELGILTVSDQEGFVANGGIVEFFRSNNRVRIRINVGAAERANIKISSKLLRLAERVKR
ncbi:MAG: YfiR family protein [Opitutales bacterium]|nr:YfiR family protein [Opitutales bacterium]